MAVYSSFLSLILGADRTVNLGKGSGNTLGIADLQLLGSTSGTLDFQANPTTTSYTLVWPAAQAAGSNYLLTNDGAGNLTWAAASATGVTSVSVVSANGFAGSVSSPTTTPAITISTTITGILQGNGTAISAASTTGSGSVVLATSPTLVTPNIGAATGTSLQLSGLSVSQAVFTDGSKNLVSNAITGTGNVVMSASPTLTGTVTMAALSATSGSFSSAINMNSNQINNLANGTAGSDAANYGQLLAVAAGLSWKNAVLVATTANITLSGEQTIDGFLTSSSRVLVKNQSDNTQNGIYVSGSGAWTRATDMAAWSQVPGTVVVAEEGTVNADLAFICTSAPGGTLGTDAITFGPFGTYLADGTTLTLTGNTFSITNGGVGTTQLANSAVTYAKIQNVAASSLLGNPTGSSAAVSEITIGATLAFVSTALQTVAMTGDVTSSANSFATTIAAGAVTASKLGTVTDGITTNQSGSGSTIQVISAPAMTRTLVAGQAFSANTSYAVRWGITAKGETANCVYAADITTSSHDLFYVIGMASSTSAVSIGGNISVVSFGSFTLGSADTALGSGTDGEAVFLTASGTISVTAPSTAGQAVTRIGMVRVGSATNTSCIVDVNPETIGVN